MANALVMGWIQNRAAPVPLILRAMALSAALFTAGSTANAASSPEGKQVNLRMQFVEIDRQEVLSFGIDWDRATNDSGIAFGLSSNDVAGGADVGEILEALAREGKAEVLAEPNLTSAEGEPASFLVGGEAPVAASGSGSDAIEYKEFGMSVEFVPTFVDDDRIGVRVRPELVMIDADDVASNDVRLSSFTTHVAEANIDLVSGQSFAIAGLFDRERSSKFTGLPDLPVISSLVASTRFQKEESELVIVVTAYAL